MSTSPLEGRVQRLDNDVQAIYELLGTIQSTQRRHDHRFKEPAEQLSGHDARFDGHDARFDGHDARFDAVDAQLATIVELLRGR